ncbi:MAG TPA: hypothetical protein VK509_01885, partial [Polyangiales bacterium]|nr:hypothetical protein [Polyangiales bacterium]
HAYFGVDEKHQGKGHAISMLERSLEIYRENGVGEIRLLANVGVGGYAWGKLGFQAREPEEFLKAVKLSAVTNLARRGELRTGILAAGKDAPAWLASQPEGKQVMLKSSWKAGLKLNGTTYSQMRERITRKKAALASNKK